MANVFAVAAFIFGSLMLLAIAAAWGSRTQNWRKRAGAGRMIFRVPLLARFVFGGIGLWLVLTPPWLRAREIRDGAEMALFLVYELMACALGSLFFWGAGTRRELILEPEHRRYRFTTGWGPCTRIHTGDLADFSGVFIRRTPSKNGEIYTVGLAWRRGEAVSPTLGNFRKQHRGETKADALAAEMSAKLSLPLVPAPPPETVRNLIRRSSIH